MSEEDHNIPKAHVVGDELEEDFLRRELYKSDEYKAALSVAARYGVGEHEFRPAMLEWYRNFKRRVRAERVEPDYQKPEDELPEHKEALDRLKTKLIAYAGAFKDKDVVLDYKAFESEVWPAYRDKCAQMFEEYREKIETIYAKTLAGETPAPEELKRLFEVNKVFDRWYDEQGEIIRKIRSDDKYQPYELLLPALLSDLSDELKLWRKEHRLEREVCWQWAVYHDMENPDAGVLKNPLRSLAPEWDGEKYTDYNAAKEKKEHVDAEEAKEKILEAFKKHNVFKEISPKYEYSADYLKQDMDLLMGGFGGASLMLPKSQLELRDEMIGDKGVKTTRKDRSALEEYANHLPHRDVDTQKLSEKRQMIYQDSDLAVHSLFRKLLKESLYERMPNNIIKLAQNAEAMKTRHEQRRQPAEAPERPRVRGIISDNKQLVEGAAAGILGAIGMGAVMSGNYPLSQQSERTEKERDQWNEQDGDKKKSRFGFGQVQGVVLLGVALAFGVSAYKGGAILKRASQLFNEHFPRHSR